ncbi:hypothetical protein GCE9029_02476 [Grimontia celer]|uniref:Uncharacterized protein n=1 Tax=Grimontia celer TaxID=1796497 RepID=A0A128F470_9GAMM|nr:hypothetical protein [Grimontia celer]CZF81230.1 hypothetical protein GCE9029_02476 [Grimontia celer]
MAKQIDKSGELTEETTEALDALSALAQKQLQLYKMTITDELKNAEQSKTLPITSIISRDGQTRSFVKSEAEGINSVVDDVAGMFLNEGDKKSTVTKGISSIVKTVIGGFLGSSDGEEQTQEKYLAYTDGITLLRFDLLCWKRNVKAKSLLNRTESVSAYYYTVSVIDAHKVDFQTFVALYQNVLKAGDETAEEIIKKLDDLNEIYKRLTQSSPQEQNDLVASTYQNTLSVA